jgi:hypothetical protein
MRIWVLSQACPYSRARIIEKDRLPLIRSNGPKYFVHSCVNESHKAIDSIWSNHVEVCANVFGHLPPPNCQLRL